jgi:hypothetical protein
MKIRLITCAALFLNAVLYADQPNQAVIQLDGEKKPQILNVTIHNEPPVIHNTNTNMNTNYLYSLQKQIQSIIDSRQQWQDAAEKQIKNLTTFLAQYVQENFFSLTLMGVVSGYAGIWARLIWLHHKINQPDNWAAWNSKTTLDELHSLSHELIAKELIVAIQKKYQSADKLADFISPLIAFIEDINRETQQLNAFIWLHDTLRQCRVVTLFPGYQKSVQQAREKLKRVMVLKNVFASWMAEYKINLSTLNPAAVGLKKALQKDRSLVHLLKETAPVIDTKKRTLNYLMSKKLHSPRESFFKLNGEPLNHHHPILNQGPRPT